MTVGEGSDTSRPRPGPYRRPVRPAPDLHVKRAQLTAVEAAFQRALTDALAAALARDESSAALLRDVLRELSSIRRLRVLADVLTLRPELHDTYPFLLPVGRALVDVRNVLADGDVVATPVSIRGVVELVEFATSWRGKPRSRRVKLSHVDYLINGGTAVTLDLIRLWAYETACLVEDAALVADALEAGE